MSESTLSLMPFEITILAEWSASISLIYSLKCRFAKKITTVICVLGYIFLYGIFMGVTQIEEKFNLIWYFRMIPLIAYMFCFIYLLLDISWKNAIFFCIKAFLIAELIASVAWSIYSQYVYYFKKESGIVMWCVVCVVFIGILFVSFLLDKSNIYLFENSDVTYKQLIIAILLVILTFFLSNKNIKMEEYTTDQIISLINSRCFLDILGYVIFYLVQKIFAEHEMMSEIASIKNTLDIQYKQYLSFREASEYIGIQCHDLKHQIQGLKKDLSEADYRDYICQIEQTVRNYDSWISTGNSILDTILTQKNIYCIKNQIELNCKAHGEKLKYLSVRDVCSIFGNIIDNAIEAVAKYEQPEKRVIHGEVYSYQSFIVIQFENYFQGNLEIVNDLPVTTKSDKQRHGYGMKSVKYIVEKYDGNISFKVEKDRFKVIIMIPLKEQS